MPGITEDAATFAWLNQVKAWCVPAQITIPCLQQTINRAEVSILQRENGLSLKKKGNPIASFRFIYYFHSIINNSTRQTLRHRKFTLWKGEGHI